MTSKLLVNPSILQEITSLLFHFAVELQIAPLFPAISAVLSGADF